MKLKFPEEQEEGEAGQEERGAGAIEKRPSFSIEEARKSLEEYTKIVEDMFSQAKAIIINNDATNVDATRLGTAAMSLFKKIVAAKGQIPYYTEAKEYVDAVDAIATMLTEKLYSTNKKRETVVSITKEKISSYAVVQEGLRREQEALERKAREDLQKKLDEKAKETGVEAPKVEAPLIKSKQESTVRTETGSAYATHYWDFEILDRDAPRKLITKLLSLITPELGNLSEISRELDSIMPYLSILYEDTRVRKAIKDGLRNIHPSIRIFEKIGTKFKT